MVKCCARLGSFPGSIRVSGAQASAFGQFGALDSLATTERMCNYSCMLVQVHVRNLATIEELELDFHPAFNVVTGETGAGKSILVDALGLALGGRASPELLRTGTREAEVEALFQVPPSAAACLKLAAAGIPCDGELVIRRVVSEGRSRAFMNGRLTTAAQLADVAKDLCDISSQHESVKLTDPGVHGEYLDAFGALDDRREVVSALVRELAEKDGEIALLRETLRTRQEHEDYLVFQLRELEELDPVLGEEETLEQERVRLRHAAKLSTAAAESCVTLYEGEDSVCDVLRRAISGLQSAAEMDAALADHLRSLCAASAEIEEAARALGRYAEAVEANPERLAEVEERLSLYAKLFRKHGSTSAELVAARQSLSETLLSATGGSARLSELEAARGPLFDRVCASARGLSAQRKEAAVRLSSAIARELARLGMGGARIVVDVQKSRPSENAVIVDGARLTERGVDHVEFLIAPNKGEEPRSLRKIASGGELSRSLLALKRVLAEKGPAGLYVFDEVDAGVSGAIAEVIGRSIAAVAQHRQVVCITHLPQIAALADAHILVSKEAAKGRTSTAARHLTKEERVSEVARMLGGLKVTKTTRKAASELIAARAG